MPDRWPNTQTLAEASTPDPSNPAYRHRVRIVRTDFKYPLLRLEEKYHSDPETSGEILISQVAMVADHALVKITPGMNAQSLATVVTAKGGTIRSVKPASQLYLVTIPRPLEINGLPDAIKALQSESKIISIAEPDFIAYAISTPNDSSFGQLYGLHNTGQTGGIADADIDAPEAWDITTGSRTVRVGVIDTGIDYTHPDLAANIWINPGEIAGNGIDDDANGYIDDVRGWDFVNNDANPMDDHYHGTHVAGTIGALGNNTTGVVGVNWQVSLVGLKFLSSSGSGSISDAVEAVSYANGLGLDLTSNSWGGGGYSQALSDAIAEAGVAGHLFIAAAGNAGQNTDVSTNYPSGYTLANIVAVAATDHNDQLASFSNYGVTSVDLAAPGVNTLSTSPGSSYRTLSGTSMATPHVAGVAALVLAHRGPLSASELKAALLDNVDSLPALAGRCVTGGRLNAAAALGTPDPLSITPVSSLTLTGTVGGPFTPASATYTLRNTGVAPLAWTASDSASWLTLDTTGGTLAPGAQVSVVATPNTTALSLEPARHPGVITFTNTTTGVVRTRSVDLLVEPFTEALFTETFDSGTLDPALWTTTGTGPWRTLVTTLNQPHAGTHHLTMDSSTDVTYARNESTLTLDLSGRSDLVLSFWARLSSDEPEAPPSNPFTNGANFDGLALSVDGITWYEIQPLRSPDLGNDWREFNIDLDAALASRGLTYGPAIRLRFNHYDNYGIPTDGLSIDDIRVLRVFSNALRLTLPASLAENSAPVTATLTATPIPATAITITLASSDPASLGAPVTVVIPAGQDSASFMVTPGDDTLLNGTRPIVITATAAGWARGSATVQLTDDETATLSLSAPVSIAEGTTATAILQISSAPDEPITAQLASSVPGRLATPATVVIPAGQTSVSVPLTAPEDTRIEGTVPVNLSASVTGWTTGQTTVAVLDNENTLLSLTSPASLREGMTGQAATVRISGTLTAALTITLASSDLTELTVPVSVVIPAGQTSATIPLTIIDDALSDGAQTLQLQASAPGFTTASITLSIADNDAHHFTLAPISGPQVRGAPFGVTLTACDVNGDTITSYNSHLDLTAVGSSGTITVTPATATGFVQGVWSGPVTLNAFATGVVLTATHTAGLSVSSTPFDIVTGPLDHFAWDAIPSPQSVDTPFAVTIRALDIAGNPITDYSGPVDLGFRLPGTVEVLSWIPFADTSATGEYVHTKQAISTYFTNYHETSTTATTAAALEVALVGKHVLLVPEQENSLSGNLDLIATALAPTLQAFVARGGTIIVCSWTLNEHLLLANSGLLSVTKQTYPSSLSVTKTIDTPLNAGVTTPFTGSYIATYTAPADAQVSLHASPTGNAVVLSRDVGPGRVILIGTDYFTLGTGMDRVVANAVATTIGNASGAPLPLRAEPALFVNGAWSGSVAVPLTGVGLRLVATDPAAVTGSSNPVDVVSATPPVGTPTGPALTLTLPAQVAEGATGLAGTLSVATAPVDPVSVTLAAHPPAKLSLPSTLVLPAGQTSVAFTFSAPDDTLVDGPRTLAVTANATGYATSQSAVIVTDNETTTLTLSAPATLAENAGPTAASITLGAPVLSPVVVNLSSSVASAATVPATVTVPAGAASVSFFITPINDVMLDGPQTTVLTATVSGWVPATHSLEVTDNETRALSFTSASAITEGSTGTASVTLGGTLTTDLVVTLASADPSQLVAPATVTIPAGQLAATIPLSAPDDTTANGTRTVDLIASAATFTSATRAITIIDNDPHHFDLDSIPSPQANQIPFSTRITARTIDGSLLTGYTGIATLSAAGTSGPIGITPSGTAAFSAGAWTGQVTLAQAGAAVRITATDGTITGVSNAFDVTLSPSITVTPDRLDVTLTIDTATTRTLTLANTGGGQLTWTLGITASADSEILPGPRFDGPDAIADAPKVEPQSISSAPIHEAVREPSPAPEPAPAFATIPLETILENLNRDYAPILAAIPSRYAFTEGVTGNAIGDGGGDMYDTGNQLSTSLSATALAYSNNSIASAPASLGTGGRYFTRKLDGLFVFAADIAGLSYFDINGNLGADGSGSTDTAILTQTRNGVTYKGFVKRVFAAGDPSVNHLVIVADNGSATHAASTSTDSDYHRASNLSGVTRIYYLLYAGTSGAYINDTSTQALFSAFLDAVGTPDFVTVSPTSGTITGGTTRDLTVSLDATGVVPGLYERTLRLTSNDPARPLVTVPVALTVQDRVLHHFEFDAMPASLVRGVPATVRLHARDAAGLAVVTFNSPVTLSATGTTLSAPVTATGWVGGTWTGTATPATFAPSATLTADNGTGITGVSAPFAVAAGPLAQLLWDPIASPQAVDTDFSVTVHAADAGGNPLTDLSGPISLSALLPRIIPDTGSAYSTDSYPFAASAGAVVREQVLYPAASLGGVPRRLASLALNLTSLSGATSLNNWTIRLKTTTRTNLVGNLFDSDGWTTVHVSNATLTTAGWQTFTFSMPFDYDGTSSLLVDFSFRNPAPASTTAYTSVSYDSRMLVLKQTSASASADPFAFTTADTSSFVPIVRFTSLESAPLRSAPASLVNGVWSGLVSLAASGDLVQLRAASTSPIVSGVSNIFTVSSAPAPAPTLPFAETWESGAFAPAWTITGTNTHRSQITSSYTPHGGTRHLTLDSSSYGTYSRNEASLTLDLAGRTGVILNFWAKGFNETAHAPATNPFTGGADFDGVAISTDGITWHEVQPLRSPALTNAWQQFTVNLDAALASRGLAYTSTFRIRFNRYGYEYLTSGGIALDDIAVTTAPVVAPALTLPAAAVESSAPLAATLSLPASRPADTVFTLTSSASAKLALPATITLPAGQTTVAFTATPINDTLIDGSRTLIITATPPAGSGLVPGTTTLVLTDDDAPSLTLSVSPASVAENATAATATLTLGTAPGASLTVALSSSDPTAATIPATLTLAPGQTSATFLVTPVNDTKIDGTQTTTLSATLPNAPPATTLFTVTDNEATTLALYGPTTTEGVPSTGSVSITGTLPAPLTVTLTSANPAQLTVPATVTIPTGSTSATFTLTAVDDTDTDGSVSVAITATTAGFTSTTTSATARDNDLHHFSITASVSSPQLANRTFTTTAYARTIDDYTAAFNGTVNLSANAGATILPTTPTSITFASGYWSGPVSVNAPATGVTLRLDDGAGHTGVSTAFNVTVGALDHFAFAPIASPQSATMPVPLTLTAQDVANNTVTSFAGTAALTAALPSRFIGTGTTNYGLPFGSYQSRTQSIYLASELGGAGRLSGLALDVISAPGSTAANFTIRVKSTTLSSYSTNAWESTGWTTVYQGSPTIGTTGWFQFNFTTPFDYDGAANLMVDVSYNSPTYVSSGLSKGTTTSATRTLWINTSSQPDPLTWSGSTPTPGTSTGVLNLRLNIQHPAVLTPSVTGTFVNGVWSGSTTFASSATDVAIQATSGNALGVSNTFTVQPGGIPNLHVSTGNFTSTGGRGGPFTPSTRSWTLTNSSSTPLAWSASKTASWFALSPASGTLDGGASTTVTASFAPDALALTLGTYADSIIFFNQTNGLGSTVRDVSLTIIPAGDLAVTPATAFDPTGDQGGPFTPATTTWTLSNPGDATLSWTAAKTASWLSLDATSGTLAPGATATVTATLISAANTLAPGAYTDTVAFTNTTTGRGTTNRAVNLTVRLRPPQIITQPANTTVAPMDNAVLKLTAATDATLTYQWYSGHAGDVSSPVSGATGPLLITPPLTSTGSFWVRIINAAGTTDSVAATVTVLPALNLNLIATGANTYGQLGNSTLDPRSPPVLLIPGVAQVSSGDSFTVFIKTDGTLWSVGKNGSGQLGDGTTAHRSTPVQIASGVAQASAGNGHTLFVKTNGTLWVTGYNASGQLGDGTNTNRSTPLQIASNVTAAWAGGAHSLILKTDGTLWATGANGFGQLGNGTTTSRSTPVQIADGVAQVAAGYNQTLFVKTNGTLWSAGYNYSGQLGDGTTATRTTPVQVAVNCTNVTSGYNHSLFVKSDGTLWAMGSNMYGQLGNGTTTTPINPVQIALNVAKTSAGSDQSLFLKIDGTLWATGSNYAGQLGDGTYTTRSTPVQVASGVAQPDGGWTHSAFLSQKPAFVTQPASVAILPAQTTALTAIVSGPPTITYQWYIGASGNTTQPVAGATSATFTTPPLAATTTYWVRASNAYGSTDSTTATVTLCAPPAITTPPVGTTVNSGRNAVLSVSVSGGALAYQWYRGNTGDISNPVPGATGVTLLTPPLTASTSYWVRITNVAGSVDSAAANVTVTSASHNLKVMGSNTYGQLGNGTTSATPGPTPAQTMSGITQICTGYYFGLILKTDGTLWATGINSSGQLGDGTTDNRSTPVQIATGVAQIAAGAYHSLFLKTNGTLWTMGHNGSGQLGDGSTTNRSTPVQIATNVVAIAAGEMHSLFVKSDGTLWSCGYNSRGQLGDGTTNNRSTPAQIATGVAYAAGGPYQSLFIKTDATLWATGYNYYGELCDGTTHDRLSPAQVSTDVAQVSTHYSYSLFLKTNGTLWSVGANWHGQLGDGTTATRFTPAQIATGVAQISAGHSHGLFVQTDGTLRAMGLNSSGQLGDGTTTTRLSPVQIAPGVAQASGGFSHSFFLQSPPPTIVTPPVSRSLYLGQTATLTVAATSPIAVTYQWYAGTSGTIIQPIAGATSATFTPPALTATTSYWVRVTNVIGVTDSATATLTLLPPPDTDSDGLPDAWETAHGLNSGSSSADNGRLGDPDRDGIPNLLEYAMGLDPNASAAQPPTTSTTATHPESGQPHLVYTYRRLIYPGALTYTVTTSTNLTTWTAPATAPEVLSTVANPDGLTETVTLRINPALGTGRIFVRLQVDTP